MQQLPLDVIACVALSPALSRRDWLALMLSCKRVYQAVRFPCLYRFIEQASQRDVSSVETPGLRAIWQSAAMRKKAQLREWRQMAVEWLHNIIVTHGDAENALLRKLMRNPNLTPLSRLVSGKTLIEVAAENAKAKMIFADMLSLVDEKALQNATFYCICSRALGARAFENFWAALNRFPQLKIGFTSSDDSLSSLPYAQAKIGGSVGGFLFQALQSPLLHAIDIGDDEILRAVVERRGEGTGGQPYPYSMTVQREILFDDNAPGAERKLSATQRQILEPLMTPVVYRPPAVYVRK